MQTEAVVLLDDDQCQELDAFLVERIYEFNSNVTGYFDGRPLGASVRNEAGEVIAGLSGNDVIDASGVTSSTMQFILEGGAGDDVLHGGRGDDLLLGGAGADRFAFSGQNGTDTIAGFQHGSDLIDLAGYGAALSSFSDLAGTISQVGADVHVDLGAKVAGAGTIVLQNTQLATVGATDFAFA